jgi:simple sugar transport system permease protein
VADERLANISLWARLMRRPEVGSLLGALVICAFFWITTDAFGTLSGIANWTDAASTLGIMAVAVALLMIGGEFDLSAGVAVTTSALVASMFSYQFTANMWTGVLVSLVVALAVGLINGYLVVKTGIPSFLVTLGTFFMLRGLNLAVTRQVTGNVSTNDVSNIDGFDSAKAVFASSFTIGSVNIRITLIWWILFVILATWVLLRTHLGNWIFATGGSAPSSRAVGVPVNRVKIGLFMLVGVMCWFTGMHILFEFNTVQSGIGVGNEFIYIVAAVVGGCLLTGGYGSVIGAAIGAFIFGMTNQGIVYAGWNPDWFYFFLGALLLGAILLNSWVRRRAEAMR